MVNVNVSAVGLAAWWLVFVVRRGDYVTEGDVCLSVKVWLGLLKCAHFSHNEGEH